MLLLGCSLALRPALNMNLANRAE